MRRYVAGLWLLSGVPVGLLLILLPARARLVAFTSFVLLETGHSISPILLAWTHGGFRRSLIMADPRKYILLPAAVFLLPAAIGVATSWGWTSYVPGRGQMWRMTDLANPFPVMVWVYWVWNMYHFGMQHFGVSQLCGIGSRRTSMIVCLGATAFLMGVLPLFFHDLWVSFLMIGAMSVNHWAVDIGLSSRVAGWWLAPLVLAVGTVGFLWAVPTSSGMMIHVVPAIIGARLGLGFVHFLYSRWVWQMSAPIRQGLAGSEARAVSR